MKIMLSAGGTGGHFYPALAVSRQLLKDSRVRLLFIGETGGFGEHVLRTNKIPFKGIFVKKLRRGNVLTYPGFLVSAIISCVQSLILILQFRPDVVVGMGGYVSGPVLIIAAVLGIPTLIHEQNTVAGLTNRILGRFVKKAGITFDSSAVYFPAGKVELTGNPVREEVLAAKKETSMVKFGLNPDKKVLLVFGGSRGARKINIAIVNALKFLKTSDLQVLHVTGRDDYELARELFAANDCQGSDYRAYPYVENMWDALACADLVVARAGATTIAEITAMGIAAILIPYPYATDNHQEKNARMLEKDGAAKIIPDAELDPQLLAREILLLIKDPQTLDAIEAKSRLLGRRDAAVKIAGIIYGLAGQKGMPL